MNRLSIRAGAALLAGSLLAIGGGMAVSAQQSAQACPAGGGRDDHDAAAVRGAADGRRHDRARRRDQRRHRRSGRRPDGEHRQAQQGQVRERGRNGPGSGERPPWRRTSAGPGRHARRHHGPRQLERRPLRDGRDHHGRLRGRCRQRTAHPTSSTSPPPMPPPRSATVDHDIGDEAARAKVSIVFTNGIEQRSLSIRVTAASSDDSSQQPRCRSVCPTSRASDSRPNRSSAPTRGTGCSATARVASITYTVDADGYDQWRHGDPSTADVDVDDDRREGGVLRSTNGCVVRVKSSDGGAELRVEVDERIRCERTDPTVNTPVDESRRRRRSTTTAGVVTVGTAMTTAATDDGGRRGGVVVATGRRGGDGEGND